MTIPECLKLLEISGAPTKATIKRAFRKAALKYHPDARGSNAQFIAIKTAYDTLLLLSAEDLAAYTPEKQPSTHLSDRYDPFTDLAYGTRRFFEPENPATEGFERKLRAKGCPYCHELGFMTKNTDSSKGFMGRERRLCKCQWA